MAPGVTSVGGNTPSPISFRSPSIPASPAIINRLSIRADVKTSDIDMYVGVDSLFGAVIRGQPSAVTSILAHHGGRVNSRHPRDCSTPLLFACQRGDVTIASILIDHGADVNAATIEDIRPLHVAVIIGNSTLVKLLLDAGADPELLSSEFNALQYATISQNDDIVKLLLNAGAQADTPSRIGRSAAELAYIIDEAHKTTSLTDKNFAWSPSPLPKLLGNGNSSVTATPIPRRHAYLHTCVFEFLISGNEDSRDDLIQLLEEGVEVDNVDENGATPLIYACGDLSLELAQTNDRGREWYEQAQFDIAKLFLDFGANVNAKDSLGHTAVLYSTKFGRRTLTAYLIEQGADILLPYEGGNTILHLAARKGFDDIVRVIASSKFGAKAVAVVNDQGLIPLHIAAYGDIGKTTTFLGRLSSIGAKDLGGRTALHLAAMHGSKNSATSLIDLGADIGSVDIGGCTPLHLAALGGYNVVVKLLLDAGARCNIFDNNGKTPLHWSCYGWSNAACVELILSHHAAKEMYRDKNGLSPLDVLVGQLADPTLSNHSDDSGGVDIAENRLRCIENILIVLLNAGVRSDILDRVLSVSSCSSAGRRIASLLIKHGADPNKVYPSGRTVLHRVIDCLSNATLLKMDAIQFIDFLILEGNADVNVVSPALGTVLQYLLREKRMKDSDVLDIVHHLVSRHVADVNFEGTSDRMSAMCIAVDRGLVSIIDLLLTNNGDPNFLHTVARVNCCEAGIPFVETLLASGADINFVDRNRRTVLEQVVEDIIDGIVSFNNGSKFALFLTSNGASSNVRDSNGNTLLHRIVAGSRHRMLSIMSGDDGFISNDDSVSSLTAPYEMDLEKKKHLLVFALEKLHVNVNLANGNGETPLFWSIYYSVDVIMKVLIDHSADLDALNTCDASVLHVILSKLSKTNPITCLEPNVLEQMASLLIQSGADVNMGASLLFLALDMKSEFLLDELVKKGLNIDVRNASGVLPLHYLLNKLSLLKIGHETQVLALERMFDILVKAGTRASDHPELLFAAIGLRRTSVLRSLLIEGSVSVDVRPSDLRSHAKVNITNDMTPLESLVSEALSLTVSSARFQVVEQMIDLVMSRSVERNALQLLLAKGSCGTETTRILKVLLGNKADPNGKDPVTKNPPIVTILKRFIEGGDIDDDEKALGICRLLISHGANVNLLSNDGETALGYVLRSFGQLGEDQVRRLVLFLTKECRCDVNIPDLSNGETPIFHSIRSNDDSITELLLSHKANVGIMNKQGQTPLTMAIGGFDSRASLIKSILRHASDPNVQDSSGRTALMIACEVGDEQVVLHLLRLRADPDIGSSTGERALTSPCRRGDDGIVAILLQFGANPNYDINSNGDTPLSLACQLGHKKVVRQLLSHCASLVKLHLSDAANDLDMFHAIATTAGADLNEYDAHTGTSLVYRLVHRLGEICLMSTTDSSEDPEASESITVAPPASEIQKLRRMVKILLEAGAELKSGPSPLFPAAQLMDDKMFSLLVEHGANVNAVNDNGVCIVAFVFFEMFESSNAQRRRILKSLLHKLFDAGANINIEPNLLQFAIRRADAVISEALIFHGHHVNVIFDDGTSPLALALHRLSEVSSGCRQLILIIHSLLTAGCDVKSGVGPEMSPPLHLVLKTGNIDLMTSIIDAGADVNAEDAKGRTALFCLLEEWGCISSKSVCEKVFNTLVSRGAVATKPVNVIYVLDLAVGTGCMNIIRHLVEVQHVNVNISDNLGRSILVRVLVDLSLAKDEERRKSYRMLALYFIDHGVNINVLPTEGTDKRSPIDIAMALNEEEIVLSLLTHEAIFSSSLLRDVLRQLKKKPIPNTARFLHNAAIALIKAGADVNSVGDLASGEEDQNSPFLLAVECGNDIILSLLCEFGADITEMMDDLTDSFMDELIASPTIARVQFLEKYALLLSNRGCRVLSAVCEVLTCASSERIALHLVSSAVDVNVSVARFDGRSPLHAAAACGSVTVMTELVLAGANKDAVSINGTTPLHLACINGHAAAVKYLMKKGVNHRLCGGDIFPNLSPLHYAAFNGDIEIINILIDGAADVNYQGWRGYTPLHIVIEGTRFSRVNVSGYERVVVALLAAGADINICDIYGDTPLTLAVRSGLSSVASILIKAGANESIQNVIGEFSHDTALRRGDWLLFSQLVHAGHSCYKAPSTCRMALQHGCDVFIDKIVERDASLIQDNIDGQRRSNLLSLACYTRGTQGNGMTLLKYFFNQGARVDNNDSRSMSLFHWLATWGSVKHSLVISLLANPETTPSIAMLGLDINGLNDQGQTPLHLATLYGNYAVTESLLLAGANPNVPDYNGCLSSSLIPLHHKIHSLYNPTDAVTFLTGREDLNEISALCASSQKYVDITFSPCLNSLWSCENAGDRGVGKYEPVSYMNCIWRDAYEVWEKGVAIPNIGDASSTVTGSVGGNSWLTFFMERMASCMTPSIMSCVSQSAGVWCFNIPGVSTVAGSSSGSTPNTISVWIDRFIPCDVESGRPMWIDSVHCAWPILLLKALAKLSCSYASLLSISLELSLATAGPAVALALSEQCPASQLPVIDMTEVPKAFLAVYALSRKSTTLATLEGGLYMWRCLRLALGPLPVLSTTIKEEEIRLMTPIRSQCIAILLSASCVVSANMCICTMDGKVIPHDAARILTVHSGTNDSGERDGDSKSHSRRGARLITSITKTPTLAIAVIKSQHANVLPYLMVCNDQNVPITVDSHSIIGFTPNVVFMS